MADEHVWFYRKTGIASDETIGPVAESYLLHLAASGELKPKYLVSSPSRTRNQWVPMRRIASLEAKWQEGEQKRKAEEQDRADKRREEKHRRQEEKQLERERKRELKREQTEEQPSMAVAGQIARADHLVWSGRPSLLSYTQNWLLGLLLLPCFGLGLLLWVHVILHHLSCQFVVTRTHATQTTGILSRSTHEVALPDIRSITVRQTTFERMLGLGTVQIGTAGTAGVEITFHGISNANHVRNLISNAKGDLK